MFRINEKSESELELITLSCGIGRNYSEAYLAQRFAKEKKNLRLRENKNPEHYNIEIYDGEPINLDEMSKDLVLKVKDYSEIKNALPENLKGKLESLLYDPLTGTLNKLGYSLKKENLREKGIDKGYNILFDLDNMHHWNNTLGEKKVNDCIHLIGRIINNNIRHKHLYGHNLKENIQDFLVHRVNESAGDEFLIYIPSENSTENERKVYKIAERILEKVYDAQVEHFLFGVHPDKF